LQTSFRILSSKDSESWVGATKSYTGYSQGAYDQLTHPTMKVMDPAQNGLQFPFNVFDGVPLVHWAEMLVVFGILT